MRGRWGIGGGLWLVAIVAASCSGDAASTGGGADVGSSSATTTPPTTDGGSTGDDGGSSGDTGEPGRPYPQPGDWGPNAGPGGPAVAFGAADLYTSCAFLSGGQNDIDHHNLVVMFDGYLLMPWAPEFSGGGISFFDVSDPCNPALVGTGESSEMRESHSIGFAHLDDEWWAVVAQKRYGILGREGGIQFWNLSDVSSPTEVSKLELDGHAYPDAYARVVLSQFWQAPYVYVAGSDNGIYIVDASDPRDPRPVGQYNFEPTLRAGQVQAVGNLLVVTSAEGPRTALLDVSVPDMPQPIPGGDFEIQDATGIPHEAYFSNIGGGFVYYAVKSGGGGLMIYDISDPTAPTRAGHFVSFGNGGYVFRKDDLAFVGESNFAGIYDVSNPGSIEQVTTLNLQGDLDTVTPIGNIAFLAVDDEANPGEATALAPYATDVDATPPRVTWGFPADGATGLAPSSRIGVTFNEMVDVKSAWEGSVRVYETGTEPALTRVDGHISVQESVVNFSPVQPLSPGTQYTFEIPAGGIVDYNGNAVAEPFSMTFTTAG